jgi:3-deoxy-D-manno-octulosonate 8-phosphate phosphatase (KDO 8-P phosphatase)
MASYALQEQARHLQALVLDVDGILSDGFVTLTNRVMKLNHLIFVMV